MKKTKEDNTAPKSKRIAKKDFEIMQNEHHFVIKKGDDLDEKGVPERFNPNLKTEEVI